MPVELLKIKADRFAESLTEIRENYIRGGVTLIEDYALPADLVELDIRIVEDTGGDYDNFLKKARQREFDKDLSNWPDHILKYYTDERAEAERIRAAMQLSQEHVREMFARLFPNLGEITSACSWRATITKDEDYHLDVYPDDRITLRAFYNFDTMDRVWGYGHSAFDLFDQVSASRDEIRGFLNSGITEKRFLNLLNERLPEVAPKEYRFPPRSLWFADSQKVAHQIKFGRRAAMFTYYAPLKTKARTGLQFNETAREHYRIALSPGAVLRRRLRSSIRQGRQRLKGPARGA